MAGVGSLAREQRAGRALPPGGRRKRAPFTLPAPDQPVSAITAIDTFRPGILAGNLAPCRAGGFEGNHFKYSSFMPLKSSSSASTTVTLAILASELPPAP